MPKTKIFIASSSKNQDVVSELVVQLDDTGQFAPVNWSESFSAGQYTLERLCDLPNECKQGIFVFAKDDVRTKDGTRGLVTRDNVVLEYGIFLARLGRRHAHIIAERGVELPTDVEGITSVAFSRETKTILRANLAQIVSDATAALTQAPDRPTGSGYGDLDELLKKIFAEVEETRKAQGIAIGAASLGLRQIFDTREQAFAKIKSMMPNSTRVDLLGVSLRKFLQLPVDEALNLVKRDAKWRVLLLDPRAVEASYRSFREQASYYKINARQAFEKSPMHHKVKWDNEQLKAALNKSNLHKEVSASTQHLKDLLHRDEFKNLRVKISLKHCAVAPQCFVAILDQSVFVEQYHYGARPDDRAAEHVPVFQFDSRSSMFENLKGHFQHIWSNLSEET